MKGLRWFRDLPILGKLGTGFGICLTLSALIGLTAYRGFSIVQGDNARIANVALPGLMTLNEFAEQEAHARILQLQAVHAVNPAQAGSALTRLDKALAKADQSLRAYEATVFEETGRRDYERLKLLRDQLFNTFAERRVDFAEASANEKEKQKYILESNRIFDDAMLPLLGKMRKYNEALARQSVAASQRTVESINQTTLILLVASVLAGGVIAWFVSLSVKRPVARLSQRLTSLETGCMTELGIAIEKMQNGDLTYRLTPVTEPISSPSKDEIGRMAAVFNRMLTKVHSCLDSYESTRANLSEMIGTLKQNAEMVASTSIQLDSASEETGEAAASIAHTMQQVASASDEAARSASQIAGGAEQLARSATQAATAMDMFLVSISEVQVGGARQEEATYQASETANAGSAAVERTIESMHRIQQQVASSSDAVRSLGEKSQQIGDIVETIQEIAQQTNLLALNAAIEAARAGDQGRGFAVVADEVRKLAERSSVATKEISALIENVRSRVDQAITSMEATNEEVAVGSLTTSEAGQAIEQIMEAFGTVREIVSANTLAIDAMGSGSRIVAESITSAAAISEETAAGAEEMSASTEEVSASAQSVSAAVEEQTAQIEEVTASAQHLRKLAEELWQIANQFKTDLDTPSEIKLAA